MSDYRVAQMLGPATMDRLRRTKHWKWAVILGELRYRGVVNHSLDITGTTVRTPDQYFHVRIDDIDGVDPSTFYELIEQIAAELERIAIYEATK